MRQLGVATLLALSLLGCGGKSSSSGDDGGSGNSGGSGVGGSGTKPRDCEVNGNTYKNGTSFKTPDGCNSCSCEDGEVSCTLRGCSVASCSYDGETYDVGEEFTTADGSVCVCASNDSIECTVSTGGECSGLGTSYQALLERAKFCDPQAANQCTLLVDSALTCGCPTFVNPNVFSKNAAAELGKQFAANGCEHDVLCGPCPTPARGYCAPNGECADSLDIGQKRACKVGGVIYPSGASGIQDPFSCNLCSCQDGVLACDDASCPKPCPDGTKPGNGCAECGPIDDCLIVEYGCMPACVETCARGACIDGACVEYCG
ncbi:MAG TPA: hypothetical protein VHP33_17190 [Polyangiaceae bacterium]|nr:hypothetical protein [Polyangiaceae bacterium]